MKRHATILATLLSAVLLGACSSSGSLGSVPPVVPTPEPSLGSVEPDITPAPSPTPVSTDGPGASSADSPTPAPSGTSIVRAYFILGGPPGSLGLVPYLFEVPKTQAVATAAMNALLTGTPVERDGFDQIGSAIPAGTKLLGLTIANGIATVDLSGEFEGPGASSSQYRLGQVVYTLTQFPTVDKVLFKVDGSVVTVFGSAGIVLDGPVGRSRFYEQLPTIFVDRPAFGAALGNPGRVAGSAQGLFEATFRVTLLDGSGKTIADQQAMAACFCDSGAFDVTVPYTVSTAQWGTLRVWDGSAKDGTPENVREYPVWLTPAR
jgi:hypothetical protein